MSGRYLCLVNLHSPGGPGKDIRPSAPFGFEAVMARQDVTLFANADMPIAPAHGEGYALLGHTFPKESAAPPSLAAKALLKSRWGMFLGVKFGPGRYASFVRDPSGQMPCYYRYWNGGLALASDLDLLRMAGAPDLQIDWAEVADGLLFPNLHSAKTALSNVYELLPGEELVVTPDGLRTAPAWSPWDHVAAPMRDVAEAVSALGDRLSTVHETIAAAFPRPLVTLSGGLDSSIVATEIARHIKSAGFLTFYTDSDPMGDERSFARAVADHCRVPLTEAVYRAPDFTTACHMEMFLPRPTQRTIAGLVNVRVVDQAFLGGHDVILGGYGGDNIFFANASAYALGDLVGAGGGPRQIFRALGDLRRVTCASYFDLFRHASQTAMRRLERRRPFAWAREPSFLKPAISQVTAPSVPHPWLAPPDDAMEGTSAHIASLVMSHTYLERVPRAGGAPHVWPLLLSPIVELCLAIPSYLWCAGGIDRSIARMAATNLPSMIADRRGKGSPMQLHTQYFERHRKEISRLLCDGMLAARGVVDVDAIRRYCDQSPPLTDMLYLRLLELADAEIWCRFRMQ